MKVFYIVCWFGDDVENARNHVVGIVHAMSESDACNKLGIDFRAERDMGVEIAPGIHVHVEEAIEASSFQDLESVCWGKKVLLDNLGDN